MAVRLWSGLILLALFIVCAAIFVYAGASRQRAVTATATQQFHPLEVDNLRARADFANAQVVLFAFIVTGQPRFRGSYTRLRADLGRTLVLAGAIATGPASRDIRLQQRSAARWFRLGDQMLGLAPDSPGWPALTNASYASGLAYYTASMRLQSRLLVRNRVAVRQGQAAVRTAVIWSGAAGLLAVLLGLLAGVTTIRDVTRPLGMLAVTVRRLAAGDHTARAPVTGTAEVRDVARSVNTLADESEPLRQREQETLRLTAAARQAGIRIRAHLDLPDMIRETVAAIEEVVPNDAAYLHLVRDGQLGLPEGHEHDWILPAAFVDGFSAGGSTLMENLLARHASLVAQNLDGPEGDALPPAQRAMLHEAGIVARIVAPFGIGSELAGIIVALRTRREQPWSSAEIGAFESIAADVGRALDHARQFEAGNRLVEELKALDQRKSDFLATISHELRTPLTSIAGFIELLRDQQAGPLTPTQQEMLDTVDRNSDRLRSLIEDVLTLSKIESGTFRTVMSPVNLADIISPAVRALEPVADAAELILTSRFPHGGLVVSGDPGQLDRVLMNLLSNAVKFTPAGGEVEVTAAAEGTAVAMTVRDTGIGIPDADQAAMLTHFFRASNAIERAIPGTGLGLSIVRTIVANHGGALDIDSREGHGTAITVRLPMLAAGQAAP
jgi:two-component system, OmpR family, phosphate regulon sensor histidine kinase PhoR